jgi:hypothetical protein
MITIDTFWSDAIYEIENLRFIFYEKDNNRYMTFGIKLPDDDYYRKLTIHFLRKDNNRYFSQS